MNYGFIKVCAATPKLVVADCKYNTTQIIECISEADKTDTEFIVFPELSITGYSCGDLFSQDTLLKSALEGLRDITNYSSTIDMLICVGMPLVVGNAIYNCAVIIHKGIIVSVIPKDSEDIYSTIEVLGKKVPFANRIILQANGYKNINIAIGIGDLAFNPLSFSNSYTNLGANMVFNLSASPETAGMVAKRKLAIATLSMQTITGYVLASAGAGESSTDVVYSGHNLIYEDGFLLAESERFAYDNALLYSIVDVETIALRKQKDNLFSTSKVPDATVISFDYTPRSYQFDRKVATNPFLPISHESLDSYYSDIFMIQTAGLSKRIIHTKAKNVIIGISGGLDSTLALIACVKAFDKLGLDRKGIIGVTMPGFGTTDRTYQNALNLMKHLDITVREISIVPATIQHFKDIGHDMNTHDVTYENSQARERTQILMDIANQVNGFVVGTGDLSELALGWATYNGDHMSMYAVNAGVPKTLVRHLTQWAANHEFEAEVRDILLDVCNTPVSPELLPPSKEGDIEQKTEDIVGPYELHDFYLYYMMYYGFSPKKIVMLASIAFKDIYDHTTILKWIKIFYKRFFTQQFKRSCLPDGPKVTEISLSPRDGLKMPSDASYNMWLNELESLN